MEAGKSFSYKNSNNKTANEQSSNTAQLIITGHNEISPQS